MGSRYAKIKGSNAERELMQILWDKGLSVARVAGSGVNPLPCPDVIAMTKGRVISFECKAHKSKNLNIRKEQVDTLMEWAARSDTLLIFAWKFPHKGWFYLTPDVFNKTGKAYTINLATAQEKTLKLEDLVRA